MSNPFKSNNQPIGQHIYPMQIPNPFGNMQNAMQNFQMHFTQQFEDFKRRFPGDPRQQIESKIASGELSQERVNAAFQQARQMGLIR